MQISNVHAQGFDPARSERVRPTTSSARAHYAIWVFVGIPACFHPNYDHPMCGPDGECPSGLTCNLQQNICGGDDGNEISDAAIDTPDIADGITCFGTGVLRICLAATPTQTLTLSNQIIDTGDASMCTATTSGGTGYCVVAATTITVNGVARAAGPKPLVLIASNSITIMGGGLIDVSSRRVRANGAPEKGAGADADATLCAAGTLPVPMNTGGGGGGSFTGKGGKGGTGKGAGDGIPGEPATLPIMILRGGCPGQDGDGSPGSGGHGGGAVYLIAGTKIDIGGKGITAGGEAGGGGKQGPDGGGGGGGGSGGMIGLDAPMIVGMGLIVANGGGGGEGGSGPAAIAGDNGTDATTTGAASGGDNGSGSGGDGGNGSTGPAAGAGLPGAPGSTAQGKIGGGGGGGGGAGLIKAPAGTNFGTKASPAATP